MNAHIKNFRVYEQTMTMQNGDRMLHLASDTFYTYEEADQLALNWMIATNSERLFMAASYDASGSVILKEDGFAYHLTGVRVSHIA